MIERNGYATENQHRRDVIITQCPICGDRRGEDFEQFSDHLKGHHWTEIPALNPDGIDRELATDGGER